MHMLYTAEFININQLIEMAFRQVVYAISQEAWHAWGKRQPQFVLKLIINGNARCHITDARSA